MKTAQINKLYSKLTPHEQAGLTFEAMARRDYPDCDAIFENVEWLVYKCVHVDYSQRLDDFFHLSAEYAHGYWKNRALMLMACNQSPRDPDILHRFLAKIASMDAALIAVCLTLKIDADAVRLMADCKGRRHLITMPNLS
jgi:hypothetical protein